MLRYLESTGLVVPERSPSGYRRYGDTELDLLRGLGELRRRFGVELDDVAFIVRLRRYIEKEPSRPRHLLTMRGVGYRFIAEPK